jgi:GNAT superfamily N-acetyltransferase
MERNIEYNHEFEDLRLPRVELKLSSEDDKQAWFFVHDIEDKQLGRVSVHYYPDNKSAEIGIVTIADPYIGKGYGQAVYEAIINICKEKGLTLKSSDETNYDSMNVWRNLEKRGIVEYKDGKYYAKE